MLISKMVSNLAIATSIAMFILHIDIQDGYEYSLLVTGVTGSGKSTFCNFLCCSDAFEANCGFASVTSKSAAATITMQGNKVKLIDTPGFCDDHETDEQHMLEFGQSLVLANKGVNAIGLIISAKDRYTTNEANTIEYMTEFPDMWPYMFIIFSNAGSLGTTEQERDMQLKEHFKQPRCPKSLLQLVQNVKNRYILVESVKKSSDPEAYHKAKTEEMHKMITTLDEANNHLLYTNALFKRAKKMIDELIKQKVEAEKRLHKVVKKAKVDIQKREEDKKIVEKAKEQVEKVEKEQREIEKELKVKMKIAEAQHTENIEQKRKEKAEVEQDLKKQYQQRQSLEEETLEKLEEKRKRQIEQEAQKEAAKALMEQLVAERKLNEELQGKRNRKWYKVVVKKVTGKDCVIQ